MQKYSNSNSNNIPFFKAFITLNQKQNYKETFELNGSWATAFETFPFRKQMVNIFLKQFLATVIRDNCLEKVCKVPKKTIVVDSLFQLIYKSQAFNFTERVIKCFLSEVGMLLLQAPVEIGYPFGNRQNYNKSYRAKIP